jgi:predicted glycoside hydrolase/deacetylase ChbG (UPF0249 family)
VGSLLDEHGYFPLVETTVAQRARPAEAARELEAQVRRARASGIRLTHLDSHMGALFQTKALFDVYRSLGKAHGLPLLMERTTAPGGAAGAWTPGPQKDALIDRVIALDPGVPIAGWRAAYEKMLAPLPPGTYELIVHLAYEDDEMRGATGDHPDWGAAWRQADLDLVKSASFQDFLRAHGFVLVGWKDLARAAPPASKSAASQRFVGRKN